MPLFSRPLAMLAAALAAATPPAWAIDTAAGPLTVTAMAEGLEEPWGLAFLPDGRFLITERDGRLSLFPEAGGEAVAEIGGLPEVFAQGQGGLLDVLVPRDFATSREIWLTFANRGDGGAGTAIGKGRLSADETTLEEFRILFSGPFVSGGPHFGARMVEAADGTVYLTTGDRGDGTRAQDPARPEGKVLAVTDAGATLHSLGHRNPQGATLDGEGRLWIVEHGAKGGDEVNLIAAGRNYGWPVISYGENYDGAKIGVGTAQDGMEQPAHYWDPSIAPSGLMIHSGRMFPDWQGDFFTGSLKFDHISRLDPDSGFAEEIIRGPETARVRDIREGPDGAIWFLSVGNGAAYRITPAG